MGLLLHFQMISFYFPFLLSLHRCSEASEVAAVKCQNVKQSLFESVFAICRRIGLFWTRKRSDDGNKSVAWRRVSDMQQAQKSIF